MGALLVLLILFAPVVLVATLANAAHRRSLGTMIPGAVEPAPAPATEPSSTPAELLVASSPFRLSVLRAVSCGVVLTLPAVYLATRPSGPLREHVAWIVVAGHAALSIGAASAAERWAAMRHRPFAGAALAGLAALLIMGAGMFQARATAEVLLGGGSDKALGDLERLLSEPGVLVGTLGNLAILITFTWAIPCAAITYGQLNTRTHPVPIAALVTFCAGAPAAITLACCYLVATTFDSWLPRRPPPGDA